MGTTHVYQPYIYRGDRLTATWLRGRACHAVRDARGKCIRGRNGNMLVDFDCAKIPGGQFFRGERAVVQARQLRKLQG